MRKLNENQIIFILKNFFNIDDISGDSRHTQVARRLLEKGSCIVPGENQLWRGGIGNFIQTKPAVDSVDCTLYIFDIDAFLNSKWYKEHAIIHLKNIETKMMSIQKEYDEIMILSNPYLP